MAVPETDRNLLFGILALQLDFVSRDQFVDAIASWLSDRSEKLDEILKSQGAVDESQRDYLHTLVERHIDRQEDDVTNSLYTLPMLESSLREQLSAPIDATMETSLAHITHSLLSGTEPNLEPANRPGLARQADERFTILRPHAKGGLGEVSIALDEQLNREVALKEIQSRFADHSESRSRFVMEAEITGGLEHPGIVPVYALGTDTHGRPFYAMRFIRGDSMKTAINRFHDANPTANRLTFDSIEFRKLLKRFQDVCNAIEYAHRRGVIHRDLKPSNVMLGEFGETLVVDWGLARIIVEDTNESHADLELIALRGDDSRTPTVVGQAVGTPAFMSPEQAEGRHNELGPAADVYSLGATMYYLLVGKIPFYHATQETLLDEVKDGNLEPPRVVNAGIPKPLEAICLKAMAKNANERYASASELADDVDRWLAEEPVSAYPEPISTRSWRWIRRHRAEAASAALVLIVTAISLLAVTVVIGDSNRTLKTVNKKLDEKNAELEEAVEAEQIANSNLQLKEEEVRRERDVAFAINDFIREDLLGRASPDKETDPDVKLRDVLDRAADSIGNRFEDKPLVEAAIAFTIGTTYRQLGQFRSSETHLSRSRDLRSQHLPLWHEDLFDTKNELGLLYYDFGRYQAAEDAMLELLEMDRQNDNSDVERQIALSNTLAGIYVITGRERDAEAIMEETNTLAEQTLNENDPLMLSRLNVMGSLYINQGRYDEAEEVILQALDIARVVRPESHSDSLTSSSNLGVTYLSQGRFQDATDIFSAILEIELDVFGEDHPNTAMTKNNLATGYMQLARYEEALPLLEESVPFMREQLGDDHFDTMTAMNNLAMLYKEQGETTKSIELYLPTIAAMSRVMGREHQYTLTCKNNLAKVYEFEQRYVEAEEILVEILNSSRTTLGNDHPLTLAIITNLGTIFLKQNQFELAKTYYEEAVEKMDLHLGEDHPNALSAKVMLVSLLHLQRRYREAITICRPLVSKFGRVFGEDHPDTLICRYYIGALKCKLGSTGEGVNELEELIPIMIQINGETHPDTINAIDELAEVLEDLGRATESERLRGRRLQVARENANDIRSLSDALLKYAYVQDHLEDYAAVESYCREVLAFEPEELSSLWILHETQTLLGRSFRMRGEFEQAESYLLPSFQAMSARLEGAANLSKRVYLSNHHELIRLYDELDQLQRTDEQDPTRWRDDLRTIATQLELGPIVIPSIPSVRPPRPSVQE